MIYNGQAVEVLTQARPVHNMTQDSTLYQDIIMQTYSIFTLRDIDNEKHRENYCIYVAPPMPPKEGQYMNYSINS